MEGRGRDRDEGERSGGRFPQHPHHTLLPEILKDRNEKERE